MAAESSRSSSMRHRKRYGRHQKHTKPFLKTYLPYLPLLLIIATGLALGWRNRAPKTSNDVLAYATSVESASLLEQTNLQRKANGQDPLKTNQQLADAAQAKADDMARRNYWSHVTPEGEQPWSFLERAGYPYQKAGENLAYGFLSSQDTIAGWMNSPTHRANLLDAAFEEVGFGFANSANYQNTGEETIVVAMYGLSQLGGAADPQAAQTDIQTVRGQAATNFADTRTYRIARIQIMTNGRAPWSLALMIISAAAAVGLIVAKHSLKLHRWVRKGERFAVTHPLFDITLVAFVTLCVYATHAEGYILSAKF